MSRLCLTRPFAQWKWSTIYVVVQQKRRVEFRFLRLDSTPLNHQTQNYADDTAIQNSSRRIIHGQKG